MVQNKRLFIPLRVSDLVTDEDEVTTLYTYDPLGRVLSKTTPHGTKSINYRDLHLIE